MNTTYIKIIVPVFILLCIAQWLVPANMVWGREKILQKGVTYRFLTEPVDPSDPFRGRYIVLNFRESEYRLNPTDAKRFHTGQTIYVHCSNDSAGFAHIDQLWPQQPTKQDVIKATVRYIYGADGADATITIDFPFTEFYMDEYKAPKAEDIYRQANRRDTADTTAPTYAIIKVLNGESTIENVMVGDKPIGSLAK